MSSTCRQPTARTPGAVPAQGLACRLALLALLVAGPGALARPGGGSSFQSAGSGSSGSSGDSSSSHETPTSTGFAHSSPAPMDFGTPSTTSSPPGEPTCESPPDEAVPDGEGWRLPDGRRLEWPYCTPAYMEMSRDFNRQALSLLALLAAWVLLVMSKGSFEMDMGRQGLAFELAAVALIVVPYAGGVWRYTAPVLWGGPLLYFRIQRLRANREWTRNDSPEVATYTGVRQLPVALRKLKARDERFSRVAFLDFATAAYHAVYTWPGTPREPALAAFTLPRARNHAHGAGRVDQVVVGSVTLKSISLGQKRHVLEVEFDANRTRNIEGQAPKREVCLETWRFERDFQAKSAPPAKLRVLTCPACGAPANVTDAGVCAHCGDVVQAGLQAWAVASIEVKVRKAFDTSGLGETVAERGTWNDTVVDPELSSQGRRVARGSFKPFFATFERDVVRPTFTAMYAAWSSLKWDEVRHLLGDRLWESQAFWMAQYREKGLSNRLEKLDIQRVEPVRAEQDADLEALTVRIFVRGLDYTVDSQGTVIGGDPSWPREFTEYWVFVRTRGARERGGAHVEPRCPNCGAPLDQMSAAGICGHCDVKVTCGDHGWVLTQIIQDESYVG